MKFKFLFSLVFAVALGQIAHAQTAERIRDFASTIQVNIDSSVTVSERIVYDSGSMEKHGIIRDIVLTSSLGEPMELRNISVTDENGTPYHYEKDTSYREESLKIGDPAKTFHGTKTYVITYTATNAVAHLKDYDEIYWNVTGNKWQFPIEHATATVLLPTGVTVLQSACYSGVYGSTTSCENKQNRTAFISSNLASDEGMSVAVGFPKGAVIPPPKPNNIPLYVVCFLVPFIVFIILFRRWKRLGKDPKGTGIIVPQYDVPDALTPMETGIIVYEKSRTKDISAELIYLATKGYITIRQTEDKMFGVINLKDYELTLVKDAADLSTGHDQKLLYHIFPNTNAGATVKLSSLRDKFYNSIDKIFMDVRSRVVSNGYYKYLPYGVVLGLTTILLVSALVIFGLIFKLIESTQLVTFAAILPILISLAITIAIAVIFARIMPSKTEKGVAALEYILGLKLYLQISEKDRLQFHNAPEKKPELFEQLLPYALVLGVENSWAKEFADLYTAPPSWYNGPQNQAFNAIIFVDSLSRFNDAAMSTFVSTPSRGGGSGGSGFSGGGGGGGGGGSW